MGVLSGASGERSGRPACTAMVDRSVSVTAATLAVRVQGVAGRRIRVAVLYGGRSSEHAISCVSAGGIIRALDPERYEVVPVGITEDGRWVLEPGDPEALAIGEGGRLPAVRSAKPARIAPEPGSLRADVVFPVLHGPWGEDGTVQGLLELAGLPYVGSGVLASAAAMEKATMKRLLAAAGLPVVPFEEITTRDWERDSAGALARAERLGFPSFVKPSRAGSSRGIAKAIDTASLRTAIVNARAHDPRIVVEEAVEGARELECAVVADGDGMPMASCIGEIVVGGSHEFYDFEAKYLDGSADLVVPAALDDAVAQRMRAMAVRAFDALGCEGLARVDFFLVGDRIIVNEVNTMPGFTPTSMYPRLWEASGIGYRDLVDRLIADALRRGTGLR